MRFRNWLPPSLLLAGALAAAASLMVPLSVEDMTRQADWVVRGTVLSKTVQRDDRGRIHTAVDFQIAETWKGAPGTNRITLVHGGGTLGGRRVVLSGQVSYEIGEECVAFLVLNPRGQAVSLGMAQGKFTLWRDSANGRTLARNPFFGGPAPAAGQRMQPVPANWRLPVDDLKHRVQEVRQ